jgi:hypothetical protein
VNVDAPLLGLVIATAFVVAMGHISRAVSQSRGACIAQREIRSEFSRHPLGRDVAGRRPDGVPQEHAELARRLDTHHVFAKGQFVVWKAGLKNKVKPDYGEPAIVTGVYPSPIYEQTETSSGSPYYLEPLSLVIGVYHEDDLLEFRVDGRRFEPVSG